MLYHVSRTEVADTQQLLDYRPVDRRRGRPLNYETDKLLRSEKVIFGLFFRDQEYVIIIIIVGAEIDQ
jgi:hypothetical protein